MQTYNYIHKVLKISFSSQEILSCSSLRLCHALVTTSTKSTYLTTSTNPTIFTTSTISTYSPSPLSPPFLPPQSPQPPPLAPPLVGQNLVMFRSTSTLYESQHLFSVSSDQTCPVGTLIQSQIPSSIA